jgi:hypothetical protein
VEEQRHRRSAGPFDDGVADAMRNPARGRGDTMPEEGRPKAVSAATSQRHARVNLQRFAGRPSAFRQLRGPQERALSEKGVAQPVSELTLKPRDRIQVLRCPCVTKWS